MKTQWSLDPHDSESHRLWKEDGKSDRLKTEASCIYRGQEKEGDKSTVEKQWPTLEEEPRQSNTLFYG